MDGIIRYTAGDALTRTTEQALEGSVPGMWIRAADFDERLAQGKQRETALQERLTLAEQRNDDLDGLLLAWYEANAKRLIRVDDAAYHIVTATAEMLELGAPRANQVREQVINEAEPACIVCFARGCNGECMENL